jgi:hypothetical protein
MVKNFWRSDAPRPWKQSNEGDLYKGMYKVLISDGHSNNGVVVFKTDKGYPAIVRAMQFALESKP